MKSTRLLSPAEFSARALPLSPRLRLVVGLVVLVALAVMPLRSTTGTNFNLSMVFVYVVVGVGLNLLTGNMGQISLGHGAFFALGAYSTALILRDTTWGLAVAILVAGLSCFVLGFLFGLPALRLVGLQLALATLALAIITPAVIKRFDDITRGQEGMLVLTPVAPESWGLDQDQWVYYICFACAVLAYAVGSRLTSNVVGRSLTGIRDNEVAAATLGVDSTRVKTSVFGLSAGFAGVGGALYALAVGFIAPEAFGLSLAIAFLTLVVVGGMGAPSGVVFGAIFIQYVPSLTAEISLGLAGLTYGLTLMLCIAVLPLGLLGLVRRHLGPVFDQLGRRSSTPTGVGPPADGPTGGSTSMVVSPDART
ncbi:branched-chain amino acid ABC transporter permease [Alloalcanivorax gelatiniphagus]